MTSSDAYPKAERPRVFSPPRRSFLPRFGLRALFCFAIVFCLVLWVGRNLFHKRQEQVALDALNRAGAKLTLHESDGGHYGDARAFPVLDDAVGLFGRTGGVNVRSVFLWTRRQSNPAAVHRALTLLPVFDEVEWVSLSGPEINDNSIDELQRLPSLKTVWLDGTQVTSFGLSKLGPPANVQELRLYESQDFGRGIARMTELRRLVVGDSPLTRADVDMIASLPHLEELSFTDVTPIDPDTYRSLDQVVGLKSLRISDREPHDADLKRVARLEGLEVLSITGISDAGLAELAPLQNLRSVEFDVYVSPQAALRFSAERPDCTVRHNYSVGGRYYRQGRIVDESELTPAEANVWTPSRGLY